MPFKIVSNDNKPPRLEVYKFPKKWKILLKIMRKFPTHGHSEKATKSHESHKESRQERVSMPGNTPNFKEFVNLCSQLN